MRLAACGSALLLLLLPVGCHRSPEHAEEVLPPHVDAADERAGPLAEKALSADWCEQVNPELITETLEATEVLVHRAEDRRLYTEHLEHDATGCLTQLTVDAGDGTETFPRITSAVVDVAAVPGASVDDAMELLDIYLNGTYIETVQEYQDGTTGHELEVSRDADLQGEWLPDMADAAVLVSSVTDGGMYPGIWVWGLARTDTLVLKVETRIDLDGGWDTTEIDDRRSAAVGLTHDLLQKAHERAFSLTGRT